MDRRAWLQSAGAAFLGSVALPFEFRGIRTAVEAVRAEGPVRMHLNENPYGPSPKVWDHLLDFSEEYGQYPGPAYRELTTLAAAKYGVTPEQCVVGNGSGELLCLSGHLAALNGKTVVSPYPSYGELGSFAERMGATLVGVPLDDHLQTDLSAMLGAIEADTGLVYICNPANPTGRHIPIGDLREFVKRVPEKTLVFVDEAYAEFATASDFGSMLPYLNSHPNLIVTRTMSKAYGLAGFRVGFGFAQKELLERMQRVRTTYVSAVGVRAAMTALNDPAWLKQCVDSNAMERNRISSFLRDRGLRVLDSQTNFVFYYTGVDAADYRTKFTEHGFNTGRPFPPYRDWCRLSLAKGADMARFMDTYAKVIG